MLVFVAILIFVGLTALFCFRSFALQILGFKAAFDGLALLLIFLRPAKDGETLELTAWLLGVVGCTTLFIFLAVAARRFSGGLRLDIGEDS
jgi:hypothetical protein